MITPEEATKEIDAAIETISGLIGRINAKEAAAFLLTTYANVLAKSLYDKEKDREKFIDNMIDNMMKAIDK
jgi:hypothetical protein